MSSVKDRLLELHKSCVADISDYQRKEEAADASKNSMALYYKGKSAAYEDMVKRISIIICGIDKGYLK